MLGWTSEVKAKGRPQRRSKEARLGSRMLGSGCQIFQEWRGVGPLIGVNPESDRGPGGQRSQEA